MCMRTLVRIQPTISQSIREGLEQDKMYLGITGGGWEKALIAAASCSGDKGRIGQCRNPKQNTPAGDPV